MKLDKLVDLACEKSPEFQKKMDYWRARHVHKPLDIEWLIPKLEDILGAEFLANAAQEEIERQEAEQAQEKATEVQDGGRQTDEIQA